VISNGAVTLPRSDPRVLNLNVGFLLKEGAGYTRKFPFDEPGELRVADVTIHGLHGTLRLTRTPQGIVVQGALRAYRTVGCVRCLTPCDIPFEAPFEELFLLPSNPESSNPDNQQYVIDEGGTIDLIPIMREEAIVSVPIQVLCRSDCKGLCADCGQNRNETACDCSYEIVDSRMESLRALLDDPK